MRKKEAALAHVRQATLDDVKAIARVNIESWRATYRGIISDEYLEGLTYKQQRDRWLERLLIADENVFIYVAVNGAGKVVGYASGGLARPEDPRYRGELYALYLLPSAQRQGLGRLLLLATARHLQQRGISNMIVWVLKENPARHFYNAMGGWYLHEKPFKIGNELLPSVAYGWNLAVLLKRMT